MCLPLKRTVQICYSYAPLHGQRIANAAQQRCVLPRLLCVFARHQCAKHWQLMQWQCQQLPLPLNFPTTRKKETFYYHHYGCLVVVAAAAQLPAAACIIVIIIIIGIIDDCDKAGSNRISAVTAVELINFPWGCHTAHLACGSRRLSICVICFASFGMSSLLIYKYENCKRLHLHCMACGKW